MKITYFDELVREMEAAAEEYGQYHDEDCQLMHEDGSDIGYVCECEKILALKTLAREHMKKVHDWWLAMARDERPKNITESRHFAAKMAGVNRK